MKSSLQNGAIRLQERRRTGINGNTSWLIVAAIPVYAFHFGLLGVATAAVFASVRIRSVAVLEPGAKESERHVRAIG